MTSPMRYGWQGHDKPSLFRNTATQAGRQCAPGYLPVLLLFYLLLFLLSTSVATGATSLEVTATPVSLHHRQPNRIGQLTFLNGFVLQSADRNFGGLSGLALDHDGRMLYAVSDRGWWFSARLSHHAHGRLVGIDSWEKGRLQALKGQRLRSSLRDAEALVRRPDGSFLVAFEHIHRLWHYPSSTPPFSTFPQPVALPAEIAQAPANGSLEAVTQLANGDLLLLLEDFANADGTLKGWLVQQQQSTPVALAISEGFRPTDLAAFSNGGALLLERRYNLFGPAVRLRYLSASSLQPGALLQGQVVAQWSLPQTVDNFEGLALRQVTEHETLIYLLSDDNFNAFQRTLLLQFRLEQP